MSFDCLCEFKCLLRECVFIHISLSDGVVARFIVQESWLWLCILTTLFWLWHPPFARSAADVLWRAVRRGRDQRGGLLQVGVQQRPSRADWKGCGPQVGHRLLHLAPWCRRRVRQRLNGLSKTTPLWPGRGIARGAMEGFGLYGSLMLRIDTDPQRGYWERNIQSLFSLFLFLSLSLRHYLFFPCFVMASVRRK